MRQLAKALTLKPIVKDAPGGAWATQVTIVLRDGRRFEQLATQFKGTPESPLSAAELQEKFMRMASAYPLAEALHQQLVHLEEICDCRTLHLSGAS